MSTIHVLHENDAWVEPLREAFAGQRLPFEEWFLSEGTLDFSVPPPDGVFYNRMSASSHTRGHRYAPEYTAAVLSWLEAHDRRVINNGRALQLEISKVAQYAALERHGIRTPRTVAAIGRDAIVDAARRFDGAFITKHNRAGKGLGVQLFESLAALERYLDSDAFEPPVDGITLIQQYIRAPEPYITRVEFIGGRLLYAVRVDTSQGFELCPAEVCEVGDAFCPAGETPTAPAGPRFRVIEHFESPLVERYQRFLAANGIEIAGIEFIVDADGTAWTYDVNTNTNYNPEAEAAVGLFGMREVATFLGRELRALQAPRERIAAAR